MIKDNWQEETGEVKNEEAKEMGVKWGLEVVALDAHERGREMDKPWGRLQKEHGTTFVFIGAWILF